MRYTGSVENQWGLSSKLRGNEFCFMAIEYIKVIASVVLPTQILDYFFSSRS